MTEARCPLCDGVFALPAGHPEPQAVLDVLAGHFEESCTGLRVARPTEPRPKGHTRGPL